MGLRVWTEPRELRPCQMTQSPHGWPPWQPPSPPHGLETEHRLTKLEVRTDGHEKRHDLQDAWNKGFTIALISLGSGVAHSKAGDLVEWATLLLSGLRP